MTRRIVISLLSLALLVAAGSAGYVVRAGDTLWQIARDHDTTVGAIVAANNLADPDRLRVGQELVIPGADEPRDTYEVRPGDTLGKIATGLGTSVAALAEANGITNINLIRAGATLRVPGVSPAPEPATPDPLPTTAPGRQPATRITHTVVAGETLSGVALDHGVSVATLVQANDIDNPDRIGVGVSLVIPGAGLSCPVPEAIFINDWGFPRPGGRAHEGNDLFASRGTPVLAPVAGEVEQIDGELGGLQFWLHATDGRVYIGSHLEAFGAVGQVAAGEVIGYVGDSGNARGGKTHVHFEILVDGESVNPYPELRVACS